MKNKKNVKEEGDKVTPDFCKLMNYFIEEAGQENRKREKKIMPVVVQDAATKEVLILAYANKEALRYSLRNGMSSGLKV